MYLLFLTEALLKDIGKASVKKLNTYVNKSFLTKAIKFTKMQAKGFCNFKRSK